MKNTLIYLFSALLVILVSCNGGTTKTTDEAEVKTPTKENFETTIDGKPVSLYTLKNKNGIELKVTNYGARFVSLLTPDKEGKFADITLGFNTIEEYKTDDMYLGCVVGRYANRIEKGKFSLNGKEYTLFVNNGPNTLHGGDKGFDKVVWDAVQDGNTITFTYVSPDGEEGYPGTVTVSKKLTLTDEDELHIDYEAKTDQTTVINLSNHSYFNLKGEGDSTILDHVMMINADYTTPVDSTLIPTGELASVEGTAFDFREPKEIGQDVGDTINFPDEQLRFGKGYDHNWVLKKDSNELSLAVTLSEKTTGRLMEIWTTEPALQFYGGNFMKGKVIGKSGRPYKFRGALVLETQHYPDSPNHPDFPTTVLEPGETYTHKAIYKFKTME